MNDKSDEMTLAMLHAAIENAERELDLIVEARVIVRRKTRRQLREIVEQV